MESIGQTPQHGHAKGFFIDETHHKSILEERNQLAPVEEETKLEAVNSNPISSS